MILWNFHQSCSSQRHILPVSALHQRVNICDCLYLILFFIVSFRISTPYGIMLHSPSLDRVPNAPQVTFDSAGKPCLTGLIVNFNYYCRIALCTCDGGAPAVHHHPHCLGAATGCAALLWTQTLFTGQTMDNCLMG
jgi:hypothetical protein